MRVKKQKRHRKVVRFFTACFGFREPYKVLCDGTFIHHLIVQGLVPADDAVSRILGGRVQLFTTRCVFGELRSLGEAHADACSAAKELITARCDHENKRVNAAMCIDSVVAEGNKEHFFVATQDAGLRKKLKEIPGIPLIFALKNALFLEKPTSEQREFVKFSEEKRLHMSELEAKLLYKKKLIEKPVQDVEGQSDGHDNENEAGSIQRRARRKNVIVQDKVQFKRKRAKGPNPLSCKKKKTKENSTPSSAKNAEVDDVAKRKRARKRSKVQKDNNPGEPGGG